MSLLHTIARVGMVLFILCSLPGGIRAQSAGSGGPNFAEVPEDVSVRFVFKSSGNLNMVGNPDIPVIVSVILSNKSDDTLSVFLTRFLSVDEDKSLDYPMGCAVRITDAKGTPLLQDKDHPDGYWTSLTNKATDDSAFRKDPRNFCEVPSKERRAFNVPIALVLSGAPAGGGWPVVDGKFIPGAYRLKVRWAGKESPEFSLTITPKQAG